MPAHAIVQGHAAHVAVAEVPTRRFFGALGGHATSPLASRHMTNGAGASHAHAELVVSHVRTGDDVTPAPVGVPAAVHAPPVGVGGSAWM